MANAPGRYWVIRHPDSQGAIVAKFDTAVDTIIPDKVADYSGFTVQQVSDRSSLTSATVDQSGLSSDEKDLLSIVYPAN